ncbi:sensor domain-containing diguanylate cyclase, partial [Eubacteriales bacterium OttesenSCG-928-M02]|nr:sensor domain-containing diguanylate cyclase [Eubacteriales bacterium OttesenSCG-928-M02]
YMDGEEIIRFWNKAAEGITGFAAHEVVGKPCTEGPLRCMDEKGAVRCTVDCPLAATLQDGMPRKERIFVRHKSGHNVPIVVNISPYHSDGKIIGAFEVFSQESPTAYEDDLMEKLSGIAMHDALTGLPNRRYVESFLNYKLDEYARFGKLFAVLFADIDNFGSFNNQYGHDVGDDVLTSIAHSIQTNIRKTDLVGRWGGEEIVGIYVIVKPFDAPILAEKFRKLISNTQVPFQDGPLHVTVSAGITVVRPSDTAESIIERADKLMYKSKRQGKNQVSFEV